MVMTSENAPVVLQVSELRKVFSRKGTEDVVAVDGVSFTIHQGECMGLVGESGSGKSTTSSMIMRMVDPSSGEIVLDGIDVVNLPRKRLKELYRHVQMVFQDPRGSFDPRRTLGDGIAEGLRNYQACRAHRLSTAPRKRCDMWAFPLNSRIASRAR